MRSKILFISTMVFLWSSCTEDSSKGIDNSITEMAVDSIAMELDVIHSGKEIIQSAFKALSGQLKSQIKKGGSELALAYCNVNAMDLTDSLSNEYRATIQRVAVKYRNPVNEAVGVDLDVFEKYSYQMSKGQKLQPVVHYNDSNQAVFYAPIVLQPNCVMCHGNPDTDIGDTTMMTIMSLYPDDQAVGFSAGDLRGLWKVSFNK